MKEYNKPKEKKTKRDDNSQTRPDLCKSCSIAVKNIVHICKCESYNADLSTDGNNSCLVFFSCKFFTTS